MTAAKRILRTCVIALTACAVLFAASVAVAETPLPTYATPEIGARAELPYWATGRFSKLASTPLSALEASAVTLGAVEYPYSLDRGLNGLQRGIFAATVQQDYSATVPILLGQRRIGELWFERTAAGWQGGNSAEPESSTDAVAHRPVLQALSKELGGQPDEIRPVEVFHSSWLFARRGGREAAAFLAYGSYGEFTNGMPSLPKPGTVLSGPQFSTLAGTIRDAANADMALRVWIALQIVLAIVAAIVLGIVVTVVFRWLTRGNPHAWQWSLAVPFALTLVPLLWWLRPSLFDHLMTRVAGLMGTGVFLVPVILVVPSSVLGLLWLLLAFVISPPTMSTGVRLALGVWLAVIGLAFFALGLFGAGQTLWGPGSTMAIRLAGGATSIVGLGLVGIVVWVFARMLTSGSSGLRPLHSSLRDE